MAYTAKTAVQIAENMRDLAAGRVCRNGGTLTAAVAGAMNTGDADPTDLALEAMRTRLAEVEAILEEIGWLTA